MNLLRSFLGNTRGNVAMIFGLAVIPLFAAAGAAVDFSRASDLRSVLQRETDSAALAIAAADTPNTTAVLDTLKARAQTHLGSASSAGTASSITVSSNWEGSERLTVTASADLDSTLLRAVPGMPKTNKVSALTQVTRTPARWRWKLPKVRDLSFEAADYNRVSVYCYDEKKKNEANGARRMETLTAIADNGGTDYSKATMPECEDGETLSYQLRNVRNARTDPSKWDKKSAEHYLYYTDTKADPNTRVLTNTVTGGREYPNGSMSETDLTSAPLLETIVCENASACRSKSEGGILPNNHETGRSPATASEGCAEGKYMYYGWEDRPPLGAGTSDRDYDDIRLVVSCPEMVKIKDKNIVIVR